MGMVPILRASISRSLRIHVPNISLSNLNSIPKKNELFCTFIRNQNNSAVERGGDDAFFVHDYNGGVVAVAGGVSGYETVHNSRIRQGN
ncbi:protein phosphatase 2C 26 [Populus alba x Populus x berolinensis]|uniref:Protein phosphatase 2C 26 n=1 Tax=Populus alba x Populus x berolinensis TaxID=444605 RepID=A0AAD6MGF7_9ROSI|nr:protein phosphatase 2C 26 [Populus alba x Populus x berolinensis]